MNMRSPSLPYWCLLCITAQILASRFTFAEEPVDAFRIGFDRGSFIVVPGRVMGKDVNCLLDTGASVTVLDKKFANSLPNPVSSGHERIRTPTGLVEVERYERISSSCLWFPEHTGNAIAMDLSRFTDVSGDSINVVLGIDYLRPLIFRMRDGIPRFLERSHFGKNPDMLGWPIATDATQASIEIQLPVFGKRPFVIDTGYADSLKLSPHRLNTLLNAGDAVLVLEIPTLDASGVRNKSLYVIREITFLGVSMRNVLAVESDIDVVGLGLMRHVDFDVDFENATAYTLPRVTTVDSFPVDASGIRTVRVGSDLKVRRIVPKSPAEGAGIKANDCILEIDGRKEIALSSWGITELLSQAGKTIPLKVKSGDQVRDIQLPLSRNFEYPPKWKPRSTDADDFYKSLQQEPPMSP